MKRIVAALAFLLQLFILNHSCRTRLCVRLFCCLESENSKVRPAGLLAQIREIALKCPLEPQASVSVAALLGGIELQYKNFLALKSTRYVIGPEQSAKLS